MIMEKDDHLVSRGRHYWKSLDGLAETPGFRSWIEKEFPDGASMLDGVQRRGFMKMMAASFGLAGLGMTSCRRPEHAILPYGQSPEELVPGIPSFYSTSMPTSKGFNPLIVESHEGRPTKIEGNPSYLPFGGGTDIYAQASVLEIYDPDRSRGSFKKDSKKTQGSTLMRWKKKPTDTLLLEVSKWAKEKKMAVLSDSSFSVVVNKIKDDYLTQGIKWFEYDPIDFLKPEKSLASALKADNSLRSIPNFNKCKRVLSLDCDFLGNREPFNQANSRSFMKKRHIRPNKPEDAKSMNRLYSVESDLTITGGVADHRLRLESSKMSVFANLILAQILRKLKSTDETLLSHLEKEQDILTAQNEWILTCVDDLCENPSSSLVLAGNHLPQDVQVAVYAINRALGAIGKTIRYKPVDPTLSSSVGSLVDSINAGEVDSLLIVGGNPIYHTKEFIDWEKLFDKLDNSARVGYSIDESSERCDLHIGQSHYLESWDLGLTWDNETLVPVQPLIAPLFDTKSDVDCLLRILGDSEDAHNLTKSLFEKISDKVSFDDFLRLGVAPYKPTGSMFSSAEKMASGSKEFLSPELRSFLLASSPVAPRLSDQNLEILLVPDFHCWDGRFANNGWMQECPDPITKLTWDNALLISPAFAKDLQTKYPDLGLLPKAALLNKTGEIAPDNANFINGKQTAPIVELLIDGAKLRGPLYLQPGLADYTIVASIGMGRSQTGRVGTGCGYDSSPFMNTEGKRVQTGVSCTPTGEFQVLANVQEHWSMEGRAIVREANVSEYVENNSFATSMGAESHSPPVWGRDQNMDLASKSQTTPRGNSSYEHPDHNYEKSEVHGLHQWGMVIDLNQCTGCSACVVACQSENNIPVVGKDQVLRGREMHWIRLDRYYSSAPREGTDIPSDVQVSFQGISCMHCETAPCESVCPVNATVHDEEGLNAMAYNRCVGTRYCANNCPYKVRRFNFFDWNKRDKDEVYKGPLGEKNDSLPAMGKNPDVTVRMRGVMEKCTYCVQRIQEAKINVKVAAQRHALLSTGKDGSDITLKKEDLKVKDGIMKTACQQVCPSDGISFGDLSDPSSKVSQLKSDSRDYSVLGYLNTRPRTTFLAKVRNPNERMPDFSSFPHSSREYHDKSHPSHHDDGHSGGHSGNAH